MRSLRLFLDVASFRSVSRAAAAHGVTQSAVSQRMRQFEKELGVRLLDRSVRPLALTSAGELLATEGREIYERYQKLRRRVGETQELLEGEVRVDAIYSAGIDLMQRLREIFEERHPAVAVRLDYKRPEEVDAAVRRGRCDIGIVSYPRRWPGLAVKNLRDERMTVVCPAAHPLLRRKVVQASDLAQHSMIGFAADLPVGRHLRRYLRSCGVEPHFTYEPDNIDTMKSMLTVGDQIAILPRRTVLREVESGVLGVVELEPELNRPIGIIYNRQPSLAAPAKAFVEFMVENADPDAYALAASGAPMPVSLAS